jgi:hypothetical protein
MPSVSKKQHNFMAAIAHNPAFAKKVGVSQSVGQDFTKADKGRTFRKGGEMKESKAMIAKEVNFFKKKGAPASMIKHEKAEMKGMKSGGLPRASKDVEKDQRKMGDMATYARGNGIESRGKTKGTMVKMAAGKVAKYARGGGIESRGKTKGTMIKMKSGGYC